MKKVKAERKEHDAFERYLLHKNKHAEYSRLLAAEPYDGDDNSSTEAETTTKSNAKRSKALTVTADARKRYAEHKAEEKAKSKAIAKKKDEERLKAVSYTHLTLPTKRIV